MSDMPRSGVSVKGCLWAAAVFLLLSIVHTYPLITGLDHLSRHNDDEWLNAWAVSWIPHQLARDPLRLFDANMYYPTERSLAYTEPLLIPGLMGAPVHWIGSSPLLTYNVLLLLGMALTGLAMYALVVKWTGDHRSGLLSGALLAFGTPMLTRLPHLQAIHFYWLPLALIAFDNLMNKRRNRDAVWLACCVVGSALTSGYTAIFVVFALGAALVVRAPSLWNRCGISVLVRLCAAAVVTVVVVSVLLHPYQELQVSRPLPGATDLATTLQMYLSSNTHVHYGTWGQEFYERAPGSFFPGVIAVVLAAIALLKRRPVKTKGAKPMLVAIAAVGVVMSLGTLTPFYVWVYHLLPPVQSLRAPNRFAILAFFSVAALAGLALAQLRERLSAVWHRRVAVGLLVVATVEAFHGPARYTSIDWQPRIYSVLAELDSGPVISLPIHRGGRFHLNAFYLLASTAHWRPMVNGFGNSRPPDFEEIAAVTSRFPAVPSVARLQALGVKYVVVHTDAVPGVRGALARAAGRTDFVLIAQDGPDRLYRINDVLQTPVGAALRSLPWSELTYRERPGPTSYLGGWQDVGPVFAVQGPERLLVHIENTTVSSKLTLMLPTEMAGQFFDVATGDVIGNVTVEPSEMTGPLKPIVIPPGYQAVLLNLHSID